MLTTIRNKFCVVLHAFVVFLHISRNFKGQHLNFIPAISSDCHSEIFDIYSFSYEKIPREKIGKKEKNEIRLKSKAAFSQINARP